MVFTPGQLDDLHIYVFFLPAIALQFETRETRGDSADYLDSKMQGMTDDQRQRLKSRWI